MTKRFATLRVLVVTDDEKKRERMLSLLETLGVTYSVTASGVHEALSLLCASHHNLQVVLADKEMQALDGMDLVLQIRCNEILDHVQVVLISEKLSNEPVITQAEASLRDLIWRMKALPIPQANLDASVIGRALHEFAGV
jgi:CheY-like chemotaxis protein